MSIRSLKIVTGMLGLVPVITGIVTLMGIHDPIYAALNLPRDALLDSNLRFFGGVWLGLGLAVYWLIPRIETEVTLFRAVWGMIFLGGVGRLLSMLFIGAPPAPFIAFTVLEVLGAPLFVRWHAHALAARQPSAPLPAP